MTRTSYGAFFSSGAALMPRGWARRRASSPSCRLVFEVSRLDHGAISASRWILPSGGLKTLRIGWYITSLASEALLLLNNHYHGSVATPGSANVFLCRVRDACLPSLSRPSTGRFEALGRPSLNNRVWAPLYYNVQRNCACNVRPISTNAALSKASHNPMSTWTTKNLD